MRRNSTQRATAQSRKTVQISDLNHLTMNAADLKAEQDRLAAEAEKHNEL